MKNLIVLFAFLLCTMVSYAHTNPVINGGPFATIILINGIPHLVQLNEQGEIVYDFAQVTDYFASSESHEAIVSRVSKEYEVDKAYLHNTRLIIFNDENALLNDIAVNNIREIAFQYNKGYLKNINITAGHIDQNNDEILATHRIDAIFQLLKDFGVKEGDISADMKIYKSDLPNRFVRIDILK